MRKVDRMRSRNGLTVAAALRARINNNSGDEVLMWLRAGRMRATHGSRTTDQVNKDGPVDSQGAT